jgi:hypothetical protein
MVHLANVYLAFLNHMQKPDGNFHNYLGYERTFLDVDGSEDCIGRALWGCGCAINSSLPNDMKMVAKDIFDRAMPWVWKTTHLRFYASTMQGLYEYYCALPDDNLKIASAKLADSFVQRFQDETKDDWRWFEPHMTYDNARLTQAMFLAYLVLGEKKYLDVAQDSMNFLLKTQIVDNVFMPIGNDGWYKHGEKRALYDQQPLEATAMVEAAVDGYYATKNKRYLNIAYQVFGWYLGKNSRQLKLYNPETAGCHDGLAKDAVNRNQGAESSISYLLARLKLEELRHGLGRQGKNGGRSLRKLTF